MKKFSIILFFLLSISALSQQYWLGVNSPVTKSLNRSVFVDSIFGWAAGDSGTIIHTSNSGANWVAQSSGIDLYAIDDIFFINHNFGWALSNDFFFRGTIILKTTNSGLNWTNSRYPDTTLVFNTIYFLDSLNGFLSGFSGLILKTTNAGANWFETAIDTAYCQYLYLMPKNKFYFVNSMLGYVCGGQIDIQGMVWKTTDGGLNWKTYCVASEPLYDIKVLSADKIIATGGDYEYGMNSVYSTDGGNIWKYELNNIFGRGYSLAFRTPSELWVPLNFSETFAVNLDSGNLNTNWQEIQTPDHTTMNSTIFMSPTFGWSFGSGGSIYKYNTAVIGIQNQTEIIPDAFYLQQNYPNPFNPSTTIGYTLNRGGIVKADIFDIQGKFVNNILNSYREKGYHSIEWNAIGQASGIYFCRVTSGNLDRTIKMLLIK